MTSSRVFESDLFCLKAICDGFAKSEYAQHLDQEIKECNAIAPTRSQSAQVSQGRSKYKSNSFTQLRWLIWRSFLSSARNPMDTNIMAIQTVIIALMFGLIYLRLELDQQNIQNINSVIFLIITNSSFSNLFGVLNTFPAEIPIFLREHQNRMYRCFNYYLSKTLVEVNQNTLFYPIQKKNNSSKLLLLVV